jgi:hypothetical protein
MDRGFALKAKLTTDKATLVYPKTPAPWQAPMGPPTSKLPGSISGAPSWRAFALIATLLLTLLAGLLRNQINRNQITHLRNQTVTHECVHRSTWKMLLQTDSPLTNLSLIERAKVGIKVNMKPLPKPTGVNLRINKREMTPITHHLLLLLHREHRGRKTRIGPIPNLRLLGPFGLRLCHRVK